MSYIVVDVESDGEYPGNIDGFSMICFGAVLVDDKLDKTFYGKTRPISNFYKPEALSISGFTRKQHESFDSPSDVMNNFSEWIKINSKPPHIFISDNPAYDWQFINFYFHKYIHTNPFGFSARRIGDLYCGLVGDTRAKWKHLRKTSHTHHPVDDATGNAEVILYMRDKMDLKIKLI